MTKANEVTNADKAIVKMNQRDEFIAMFEAQIVACKDAKIPHTTKGQVYVISCDDLCLSFSQVAGKITNPHSAGGAHKADRFVYPVALRVARTVTNGRGTRAVVQHVNVALDHQITVAENAIERIKMVHPDNCTCDICGK